MAADYLPKRVLVLDDSFDTNQRSAISSRVDEANFVPQEIGSRLRPARQRAVAECPEIAQILWSEVGPHIGSVESWVTGSENLVGSPKTWFAFGCNPRSRLYRYDPGADFAPHKDIPWRPSEHTQSLLTILVYLPHDECVGGETVIEEQVVQVVPWRIVVFNHEISHEGRPIDEGQKTVLRNDVLIRTT